MLIKILDKEFRPYISSERLAQEIKRLAQAADAGEETSFHFHTQWFLHVCFGFCPCLSG